MCFPPDEARVVPTNTCELVCTSFIRYTQVVLQPSIHTSLQKGNWPKRVHVRNMTQISSISQLPSTSNKPASKVLVKGTTPWPDLPCCQPSRKQGANASKASKVLLPW
jgi:hypothetical protein